MAQIFPRWTNRLPPLVAAGAAGGLAVAVFAVWYWFSPEYTDVGYRPAQPVAFSHRDHAGKNGMDCRYCHNTVERGRYAAVPTLEACMTCHKTMQLDSKKLVLVRAGYETGRSIKWVRVHMLPDYAFFHHGVHLAAGVGCATCHGRIDRMEVVRQVKPLSMSWCLKCHRDPAPDLRPVSEITNMEWKGKTQKDPGIRRELKPPVYCSGCHR